MSIPTHFDRQDAPGAGTFEEMTAKRTMDPDTLEVAPGRKREGIEGWVPELASETELREALEKAFDYRGDVTLTQKDGSKIEGYIFDRVDGTSLSASFVRILPKSGHRRTRFQRARSSRRKELGSLGEEVLGKEGVRRRRSKPASGPGRVSFARVHSTVNINKIIYLHVGPYWIRPRQSGYFVLVLR